MERLARPPALALALDARRSGTIGGNVRDENASEKSTCSFIARSLIERC